MPRRTAGPLRQWRVVAGIDQATLARLVGVGRASISRWESGDAVPSQECIERLARALGRSEQEILDASTTAVVSNAMNDPVRSALGPNLRMWRHASGQSLREVASRIGVTATTVSAWETGRSWPSVPEADLETALDVPVGSIAQLIERIADDLTSKTEPTPLSVEQRLATVEQLLVRVTDLIRSLREEMGTERTTD